MRRSLTEIAHDLGLNIETLERWIRQGKIPVHKQESMGIYNESEYHRWAEKHRKTFLNSEEQHYLHKSTHIQKEPTPTLLLSALKKGGIFYDITCSNKNEAIKVAVELIPDFSEKDKVEIYNQLMERESLASTGIGKGVAIPHPRNPLSKLLTEPIISTFFLKDGVDFNSIDYKPVSVMFLILCPTIEVHLNLLSRLSFCLRDNEFMEFIMQKPDENSIFNRIRNMELNPVAAHDRNQ